MLSKIIKDTGISGLGEFFYVLASYATDVMISRFLGAEGVGIYAQAITIVLLVSLLAQFGFDVGILRFLSLYLAKKSLGYIQGVMYFASWLVLITGVILSGGVFVAADLLANSVFNEPQLTFVLRMFVLTVPFIALRTIWLNGIQAFQRADYRIYIGRVFVPLVSAGSIALFLHLGWYWNGVISSAVLTAVAGGILAYYIYHQLQKSIPGIKEEKPQLAIKEWLLFCYPLFFSQLFTLALPRATILMLGYFQDSAEVGIYEIVSKITLLVQMPLDMSSFVFAPMIGNMYAQDDRVRLQRLFKTVTKWVFAVSILFFLTTTLLAQPILATFGPEFVAGIPALYILAFGHLLNVSTGAVGWMLIMSGYSRIHLLNSVLSIMLTIALGSFLIPLYGIIGGAAVVSLVEIVVNIVRLAEVFYLLRIHPYRWDFIKPVLSGLMTLGVIYLLQREIVHWSNSMSWTPLIVAGSICTLYITFSVLFHWPQIKTSRLLLLDQ
jgi:O-antigen/teichoic acid export membrane protein